jgi:hypothetical protein
MNTDGKMKRGTGKEKKWESIEGKMDRRGGFETRPDTRGRVSVFRLRFPEDFFDELVVGVALVNPEGLQFTLEVQLILPQHGEELFQIA